METIEAEYIPAGEVEPSVALTPIPQQNAILTNLKAEGERFLAYAKEATVTDLDSEKRAGTDVVLIRGFLKEAEAWRKRYKAPLLEAGRDLDRFIEGITEPFKAADQEYTRKITGFHADQERARKEAETINQVVGEAVVDVPDQQKRVRAEVGTLTFTTVADKEKIQAAVDSGVREIPGVAIYPVWMFKVLDLKAVPDEYKKTGTRATR